MNLIYKHDLRIANKKTDNLSFSGGKQWNLKI